MSFPSGFSSADQLNDNTTPVLSNTWAITVVDKNGSPTDELVRLDLIGGLLSLRSLETTNFTAVNRTLHYVDTNLGAVTGDLPASPNDGDTIGFVDAVGNLRDSSGNDGFNENTLTIDGNGTTINGNNTLTLYTNGASAWVQYDSTLGEWIVIQRSYGNMEFQSLRVSGNFNVDPGKTYLVSTSGGPRIGTLAASPSDGDVVAFVDADGVFGGSSGFGNNSFTIARNGNTIGGTAANLVLNVDLEGVWLVFNQSTNDWEILNYQNINSSGGLSLPVVNVSGAFATTIGASHHVDSTAGASSTTLPVGTDADIVVFVDEGEDFSTNNLTISPGGGDSVAGNASLVLDRDLQAVWLQYNANENDWAVIAEANAANPAFTLAEESLNFNAVEGTAHHVTTTGGVVVATLPTGPTDGAIILFADAVGSDPNTPTGFGNNSLTINPDAADTIQGFSSLVLDQENDFVGLQYVASTNRWNVAFGLTSPSVFGAGGAAGDPGAVTENGETLAGDKTLLESDPEYQFLDPGGANRNVDLPTTPSYARRFVIFHDGGANSLDIRISAVVQDTITTGQQSEWVYSTTLSAWRQIP